MHNPPGNRLIPVAAIGGALLLFAGTWLHPMQADPNDALAAFTEYAADRPWVASHLMQLFGVALMVTALLLISRTITGGAAAVAAFLGSAGAIASLAVAAALQAVDGIALKAMVNAWAAAPPHEKAMLFDAAFAVRQIEIGLASMTSLLFGLAASIYGIAFMSDSRFPKWLGFPALAGGVPTAVAGVAIAYTGFSDLAMSINLPANFLLLGWMIALGVWIWRDPASQNPGVDGFGTANSPR
jgi:hypothetical protein